MYRDKKKISIIVMMIALFVMVVGYAAFSANLNILGTANIASNWNVYISNVETKEVYGKAENMSGSPTYSNLMAEMIVDLKEPGDYITYEITVTNGGTLDAIIENVQVTNLGTSAIVYTIDGVNNGDSISNGDVIKFTVTIEYDPSVTSQPETTISTSVLDIVCVQDINQNIQGGDIEVTEPTITTLSGNNTLTLNSAFPTNLANYKITGNSVQDGTPSPSAPVEIISVGEKTINLFKITGRTQGNCEDGANTALRKFEFDKYYVGLTSNNYCYSTSVNSYSINDDSIIVNTKYGGYGIGYPFKVKPNTKYSISWDNGDIVGIGFYTVEGEYITNNGYSEASTITTPENCEVITLIFRPGVYNEDMTYTNIQLEESTKPTIYEPYGYKIPVTVGGKNLFNTSLYKNSVTAGGVTATYLEDEDVIVLNGTATATTGIFTPTYMNIPVNKGTTFSITAKYVSGTVTRPNSSDYAVAFFGASDTINVHSNWANSNLTQNDTNVTAVCNYNYITRFWFYVSAGVSFDNYKVKIQLEKSDVPTEYEQYKEPITTNIYLDEPLRCINGYCDYIDFENKTITRNIRNFNFVVSNMNNSEDFPGWQPLAQLKTDYPDKNLSIQLFTDIMSNITTNDVNSLGVNTKGGGVLWLQTSVFGLSQTEWITNYPDLEVNVMYRIATPEVKSIDLPQIYIPQGNVMISVNSNGLTIPIEVSYYKK